jgi:polar amino acid transport system substrate-binding protein
MAAIRKSILVCLAILGLTGCPAQHQASQHEAAAPREPALRVAVVPNTPPYAFRQDGQLVGLEVDFAHELAAALGRPLDLAEIGFEDLIPAVRGHRVDIVMAGMTITRARQVQIAFSDPYLRSGLVAIMRREDVSRFKKVSTVLGTREPIGVVSGTTAERFVREHVPDAPVMVYPDVRAAMNELRTRRVTLVVHDAPVAIWYAAGNEADFGVLLELLDDEPLGWGLARDNESLTSAVNGVLTRWRSDGTRDRILGHWIQYWQRLEAAPVGR